MKKSKWADWLVVIGFLGFLALALAVTLVRPKSGWSYYENRNLARPAGCPPGPTCTCSTARWSTRWSPRTACSWASTPMRLPTRR